MDMKHTLLVFSGIWAFTLGGKPTVTLFPDFPAHRIYVLDELTLRCEDGGNILQNDVQWYKDKGSPPTPIIKGTLHFPLMAKEDAGKYQCGHGREKSDEVELKVHDMLPQASLSVINRANTVVNKGDAVLLKLHLQEGLADWWCRYAEGDREWWLRLVHPSGDPNSTTSTIHADVGEGLGRTYWCVTTKEDLDPNTLPRSNAIKLTATGKMVKLQMSERPALLGDNVTVTCDVWGGAQIDRAEFYKDGRKITTMSNSPGYTYIIRNISQSDEGSYQCTASYRFTHISKDAAIHNNYSSDQQVLKVIAGPPKPRMDCSTRTCEGSWTTLPDSYIWLNTPSGRTDPEILIHETEYQITQKKAGKYMCMAKWKDTGLSRRSNKCLYQEHEMSGILVVVLVVLFVVGVFLLLLALFLRKRLSKSTGGMNIEDGADGGYEEVGKKEGGGDYELLKLTQKEKDKSQYETLKGQGKTKGEGEYEALKVEEGEGSAYQTLKEQGQAKAQGQGEYEALKSTQAEVYQTLKDPGQAKAQGQGEYEALKSTQAEVYQTLKDPGQAKAQGQGEYEALKSTQAEVYQTLKDPGQAKAQGQGEYEALKTTQPEVYQTLKDPGQAKAQGQGEYEALKTTQPEVYQTLGQEQGARAVKKQGAKEEDSPYEELKKEKDPK